MLIYGRIVVMKIPSYTIHKAVTAPSLKATVGTLAKGWENAEVGEITAWHKKSGALRPTTYFRALYDEHNIYVRFDVMDRYIKAEFTELNDPVCEDSCVEFFIQPAPGSAYFNFEINAIGTMLLYCLKDPTIIKVDGKKSFTDFAPVAEKWAREVEIYTSIKAPLKKPIEEPMAWTVCYRIPIALFTAHIGKCSVAPGDKWRGNFFKCGGSDHFGMWSDVGARLNFHQPKKFGELIFG